MSAASSSSASPSAGSGGAAPATGPADPLAGADPRAQLQYQIRFDWGQAGAAHLDAAEVLVWVDQLGAAGDGSDVPPRAGIVAGSVQSAAAVARWVLDRQAERGDRVSVAVVAAGAPEPSGGIRFAVEDLLAAGAVIDALAELGLDHASPEAAAAGSAFAGLRQATSHLISASITSRELGRPKPDLAVASEVAVLREFTSHA